MKILIVKLSSLGDVVQTLPVVADILAAHPDAQIDWVVEEAFASLVVRVKGINRVISCALRRWRKSWFAVDTRTEWAAFKADLQSTIYDVVIDCQGLTKSALVARMAKLTDGGICGTFANKSEACGYEWLAKFLLPNNQAMPKRIHAVARTRLLVSKMLGDESNGPSKAPARVEFKNLTPQHGVTKSIMLTHGTTRADNEWPLESWLVVGKSLVEQGYELVAPQATEYEERFCEALKKPLGEHVRILPRMNLSRLLDAMSTCSGVIGVDSGLSHMAVALGLPHVQIFSQDRAWRAGPLSVADGGVAHQVAIGGAFTPSAAQVWQAWLHVSNPS